MLSYYIKTFGCAMNYADTARIGAVLDGMGLIEVANSTLADIVIFTTCSIKQKAEDKVFSLLNNVHKFRLKKNKNIKIILTGCMIKKTSKQTDEYKDELLKRIPVIDLVFRIEDLALLPNLLELDQTPLWQNYFNPNRPSVLGFSASKKLNAFFQIMPKVKNPFQAFVPIQTGCDNFCTYCIVPYTRGREQSRPMTEILNEINFLVKQGLKEVILVGQNVNSYGKDFTNSAPNLWNNKTSKWEKNQTETPFTILLKKINEIEGIKRIRFQSANPHDMTDDIITAIISLEKVMPSVHLALQSGDDAILQRMNRKHNLDDFIKIIGKIRQEKPDFTITTDIIVGFCGETDEAFNNTLKAVSLADVDLIYISQYSPRIGTISAKKFTDDVPAEVKKQRWHELNNWLKKQTTRKLNQLIGTKQEILVESQGENFCRGKTRYNHDCQIINCVAPVGDIIEVEITANSTWALTAIKKT